MNRMHETMRAIAQHDKHMCPAATRLELASRSYAKRFTVYRPLVAEAGKHDNNQMNAGDQPQFEGVVFSDGSVALRWLTACRSTSVWACLEDMLKVHGHPEYGTYFVWHDGEP